MEDKLQSQANNDNKAFMQMIMQNQKEHMMEMNAMNAKLI